MKKLLLLVLTSALLLFAASCGTPSVTANMTVTTGAASTVENAVPDVTSEPSQEVVPDAETDTAESVAATETDTTEPDTAADTDTTESVAAASGTVIDVTVGDTVFTAELADNPSARAFAGLLANGGITVEARDYGGFEKVGELPESIVRGDEQLDVEPGDIILYQGNQISVYYGENSWSLTRLGKIQGAARDELASALGEGSVTITFSLHGEKSAARKTLVAYFSATGNTKSAAESIAAAANAELYEIVPEIPYTSDDLNYSDSSSRAAAEQDDEAARPAISGGGISTGDYDVIFIGYPIWFGRAPKIISTFLESGNFSGKTVIPFCTSHSSGIGVSDVELHTLAPDADWMPGNRFSIGAPEAEITEWVNGLGLYEK